MTDHVYKVLELVGSSPESIEKAIENAIEKAAKTIRQIRWFQVADTRGYVQDNKVAHYQVTVRIGFTLED